MLPNNANEVTHSVDPDRTAHVRTVRPGFTPLVSIVSNVSILFTAIVSMCCRYIRSTVNQDIL